MVVQTAWLYKLHGCINCQTCELRCCAHCHICALGGAISLMFAVSSHMSCTACLDNMCRCHDHAKTNNHLLNGHVMSVCVYKCMCKEMQNTDYLLRQQHHSMVMLTVKHTLLLMQGQVLLVGECNPAAEPVAGSCGISGHSLWSLHSGAHSAAHHGGLSCASCLHPPLQGRNHRHHGVHINRFVSLTSFGPDHTTSILHCRLPSCEQCQSRGLV